MPDSALRHGYRTSIRNTVYDDFVILSSWRYWCETELDSAKNRIKFPEISKIMAWAIPPFSHPLKNRSVVKTWSIAEKIKFFGLINSLPAGCYYHAEFKPLPKHLFLAGEFTVGIYLNIFNLSKLFVFFVPFEVK